MSKIGILNTLVTLENILCVYRNYSILKRNVTNFIKLRIFIETCFILYTYSVFAQTLISAFFSGEVPSYLGHILLFGFVTLWTATGIVFILLSYYNSTLFIEFVSNVEATHELFANDAQYQIAMKKHQTAVYIHLGIFAAVMVTLTASKISEAIDVEESMSNIIINVLNINQLYRYSFEFFMIYEIIEFIMVPLSYLELSVSVAAKKIIEDGSANDMICWREVREGVETWATAQSHIVAAGERFSDCFKVQIMLCLITSTIYYISSVYRIIAFAKGVMIAMTVKRLLTSLLSMLAWASATVLAARAGQRVQNTAQRLHRTLVSICNTLAYIPGAEAASCACAVGALARRLRAAPLCVRLTGARAVGAALLVDMLALVANYTVVLLQFYHVV